MKMNEVSGKQIILVFGRLCSGKGTYCEPYIKQGYNHITTSDVVKSVSGKSTRSELTKTSNLDQAIADEMIDIIKSRKPIIVDGIRQKSILDRIIAEFGETDVDMVWLEVPSNIRKDRFNSRASSKDDQSFDDAEQGDHNLGISDLEKTLRGRARIVDFH